MKRYTVIDHKTGYINSYTWIVWRAASLLTFILGMLASVIIFTLIG